MSYDASYPPPPPGYQGAGGGSAGEHPDATKILVMGILSLVCCTFLGPITWFMANKAQAEEASGAFTPSSNLKVGKILAIVATAMLALGVVAWILLFVAGGLM